jgi:hypothetical protein
MWNHRIVCTVDACGCEQLELVEVFYDTDHAPYAYGEATIVGESLEDIKLQLDMFDSALSKGILSYPEDFTGDVNK